MSDELSPGAVSLEGDTPTMVGPPLAPSAPAAEASEAPAPDDDETEPEGITIDLRGEKMVPLSALKAVREKLHVTKEQAKAAEALKAEVEQLRPKAQSAEQTEAWVDSVRPLLTKLKDRPDIVKAIMEGSEPALGAPSVAAQADTGPLSTEEAEDLARTLELYDVEGKPDTKRAQKMALTMAKMAGVEANKTMAPVTGAMVTAQAGTLKAQYAGLKDKSGRSVNGQVLDQMFKLVPAELVAKNPEVAGVLYYAAKGYAAHHGLDEPAPPPNLPVVTEASGGGKNAAQTLSEIDRKFAKVMGSEKTYRETASGYKPGAINVLE